jgi:hypothetical protein
MDTIGDVEILVIGAYSQFDISASYLQLVPVSSSLVSHMRLWMFLLAFRIVPIFRIISFELSRAIIVSSALCDSTCNLPV